MTSGIRRVHACVCGSASFVVSEQAYQLAAEPKQLVVDTLAAFFQNGVSARQ